jgi:hypothetical protein
MLRTGTIAAAILVGLSAVAGAAAQTPALPPLDPAFQNTPGAPPPTPTMPLRNVPPGSLPDAVIDSRPGINAPDSSATGNLTPAERAARAGNAPPGPVDSATPRRRPVPGQALLRQRQAERTKMIEEEILGHRAPPPAQARRSATQQSGLQPRQTSETDPMRQLGLPPIRDLRQAPGKTPQPAEAPVYDGFDRLDRNGDGYVSRQEYLGARSHAPSIGLSPDAGERFRRIDQSLNRRFRAADSDRDGRISAEESRAIGNRRF